MGKRKEEREERSVEMDSNEAKVEAGPIRILQRERPEEKRPSSALEEERALALESEMTPNGQLRTREREEKEEGREASSDGERGRESVLEKQPKYSSRGNYAPHKNRREHQPGSWKRLQPRGSAVFIENRQALLVRQ